MFPAKFKHLRNICETASITHNKRILQTALLNVSSTKRVESMLRFRELETGFV